MQIAYEEIIENIKNAISEKGMKQKAVAERAGLNQQELSNILNKKRKLLRVEHIKPLADAIGVPVNCFFDESKKRGENNADDSF